MTKRKSNQPKRKNLSKEEIILDMEKKKKVQALKDLVRKIYPTLEKLDTIYDAQTTVNALMGFIDLEIEEKVKVIGMADISIDLSKQEDTKITSAMKELINLLQDISAEEASETLERLGSVFSQYASHKFLQGPMSTLTVDELVAK